MKGGIEMARRGGKSKKGFLKEGCKGAIYGLGLIGAAIYYISEATGFWVGVLGFLKAVVWPVFVILELLRYLGA
jgi:hypothetical protein